MNLQQMQDIAQRRTASLQYYREQYDGAHPRGATSPSSSVARPVDRRYTDGEDEIDSAVVCDGKDEVDSVRKCFTRANVAPSSDQS